MGKKLLLFIVLFISSLSAYSDNQDGYKKLYDHQWYDLWFYANPPGNLERVLVRLNSNLDVEIKNIEDRPF